MEAKLTSHLQLLNVEESVQKLLLVASVGLSKLSDRRGDVEDDGIGNDHPFDGAEDAVVLDDEAQSRVQDHRLACDQADPSDGAQEHARPEDKQLKVLADEADEVGKYAGRGGDEGGDVGKDIGVMSEFR